MGTVTFANKYDTINQINFNIDYFNKNINDSSVFYSREKLKDYLKPKNCLNHLNLIGQLNLSEIQKYIYTDSYQNAVNILNKISELEKTTERDDFLTYIFDTIEDSLLEGKIIDINTLLIIINVDNYTVESLLGILTVTLIWKNKLFSRNIFFTRVKELIFKIFNKEEAEDILSGLE